MEYSIIPSSFADVLPLTASVPQGPLALNTFVLPRDAFNQEKVDVQKNIIIISKAGEAVRRPDITPP